MNNKAKIGAKKNLKTVPVRELTLFRTYLLIAVEDPQRTPAINANAPAMIVPDPV